MVHIKEHPYQKKNQETPYFMEVQRFRQTWIWVLLGAILGTLLFLGAFQAIQLRVSGIHWLSTSSLLLMGGSLMGGPLMGGQKGLCFVRKNLNVRSAATVCCNLQSTRIFQKMQ